MGKYCGDTETNQVSKVDSTNIRLVNINSDSEIQNNEKSKCNCHFSYWSLGEIAIVLILLVSVAKYAY